MPLKATSCSRLNFVHCWHLLHFHSTCRFASWFLLLILRLSIRESFPHPQCDMIFVLSSDAPWALVSFFCAGFYDWFRITSPPIYIPFACLRRPSLQHDDEEHEGMDSATLAAHEEATRVKTVNRIFFGGQEIGTWYFSPYPAEAQAPELHICEFCLSFFLKASELLTHSLRCTVRHPPGNEIYRDGQSVAPEYSQAHAAAAAIVRAYGSANRDGHTQWPVCAFCWFHLLSAGAGGLWAELGKRCAAG